MSRNKTQFWTKVLNDGDTLEITAGDNVTLISIVPGAGASANITGTRSFRGMDAEPVTVNEGQPVLLPSHGQNDPIECTIEAIGGAVNVMIQF